MKKFKDMKPLEILVLFRRFGKTNLMFELLKKEIEEDYKIILDILPKEEDTPEPDKE